MDLLGIFLSWYSSVALDEDCSARVSKEGLFEDEDEGGVGNGWEAIRIDVLVILDPMDLRRLFAGIDAILFNGKN